MSTRVQQFKTEKSSSRVEQFKQQLLQESAAPITPVIPTTIPPVPAKSGLVKKGVVQGFEQAGQAAIGALKSIPAAVNEFSKLGQRGLQALTGWIPGMPAPKTSSLPNKIVTPSNPDQQAGFLGGQIAQTLIVPEKSATAAVDAAVKASKLGKLAPVAGAVGKAAVRGGIGAGVSKVQGASDKGAATVGAVSAGLSLAGSAVAPLLKNSAKRSMSQALGATTKENKQLSEKVVPELLDRKTVAVTREGLFNKASTKADKAGAALEKGYESLPKNATTDWKQLFENLQKAKDEVTVNGVVLDVGRHRALEGIQKDLFDIVGGGVKEGKQPVVSVETARKVRQILDKAVSQKSKVFGLTGKETDRLAVQKLTANSIRSELAKEYPDIARLNKEFNFWSNVQQVVGDTIRRTRGQTPIGLDIAEDAGAVVGAVRGGTIGKVVADAFLLRLIKQATTSTAWRTTSALTKHQLSNFLAAGNVAKATVLLQKLVGKKSGTGDSR